MQKPFHVAEDAGDLFLLIEGRIWTRHADGWIPMDTVVHSEKASIEIRRWLVVRDGEKEFRYPLPTRR